MTCTICGKASMSGATLCAPCRAALKRARYVSVQVVPPRSLHRRRSSAIATSTTKGVLPAGLDAPAAIPGVLPVDIATPPPLSRNAAVLRSLAMGAAAVVILGLVAYIGQSRDLPLEAGTPSQGHAVATPSPVPAPAAVAAKDETLLRPASTESGANIDPPPAANLPPPVATEPSTVAKARNAEARTTPSRVAPIASAPATTNSATGNVELSAFGAATEPSRPAPVARSPVAAPPPPDRWQVMESELARCDREGGFGGFICGQRVRIQSCEGQWGNVPQCAVPPENPRGQ